MVKMKRLYENEIDIDTKTQMTMTQQWHKGVPLDIEFYVEM